MIRSITLVLTLLLLSACATTRSVNEIDNNKVLEESRLLWLQQQHNWQFEGRFSIRIDDGQKSSGGSGNLSWKQAPDTLEMDFYGAFGRGAWHLLAKPEQAVLSLADGRVIEGVDVGAIIKAELGWDIPIEEFSLWLRGIYADGSLSRVDSKDDLGRPKSISHQGWQVKYLSWMEVGAYTLPKKIELTAPGRKLKLSVKNWKI